MNYLERLKKRRDNKEILANLVQASMTETKEDGDYMTSTLTPIGKTIKGNLSEDRSFGPMMSMYSTVYIGVFAGFHVTLQVCSRLNGRAGDTWNATVKPIATSQDKRDAIYIRLLESKEKFIQDLKLRCNFSTP